jgi:uncharacterized membrane protein YgcG
LLRAEADALRGRDEEVTGVQGPQRALAAVVLAAGLALVIPAAPAQAQATEQILDYAVDLRIEAGGALLVTERIAYDFGTEERHGILRDLPVRFRYDGRYDRVYPVHVLNVSGSPGTPAQYKVEDVDAILRIRIGDPDQIISGRHGYTIVYRVEGTLNGFADHDELYWNAIGTQWEVPIKRASVRVSAPAAISRVACYAGPAGSKVSCASSRADGRTASFAAAGLDWNEGVTVVVGFPTGVVPAPRPILDERWSMARAFAATPGTLGVAGGVLLAVVLVLGWLLGMTGRDRRDGRLGGAPVPVAGAVVESVPPEGIRPAQAGLLVDEVVRPVALTATLVDLAVRGYLRIEELPDRAEWLKPDWRLVKLKAADQDLLGYERALLDGLFASRRRAEDVEAVQLSDLEAHFYDRFERVRMWLYRDAVQRRWFTERPDKVRGRWVVRGLAVTVVGAALTALAVWLTHFGLAAIPILLAGPVLLVGARRMPTRTPVGTELLRRVSGFRTYLETAGVNRAGPAQAADQFSPYLPYAIVFGLTEQWTRTFALVGAPPQTSWYGGRDPYPWDRFPSRIDRFASSSAATLTAPPAAVSGSSGFGGDGSGSSSGGGGGSSGGGGGGGGGGSW